MGKSLFSILVMISLIFMFESCYRFHYNIDDYYRIRWKYEEDYKVSVFVCNRLGKTLGGFQVDKSSTITIYKYEGKFHVMEEYCGWENSFSHIIGDSLFVFYIGKQQDSLYKKKFFTYSGKDKLGYNIYKYKKIPFITIEFEDNYAKTYDDVY